MFPLGPLGAGKSMLARRLTILGWIDIFQMIVG